MGNRSSSRQQQGLVCPSETNLTDFQLVRFIGAGTFGKVFVFLHKGLKKEYALKIMCKRRICRRKFAENVLSELELLQGLSHPFISSLWYAFQDCDYIYMISDLLLGGDLSYHLKNQGRFSESRAKLLICELALALDYLHRQRVGHFDVKPANILLDDQGHAHLSDFGLARHLAEGELVTAFCGTRPYMAPEILLTALEDLDGYDWRVDWWALGVCFYEMLRGRTPHEYPASFSSLQVLSIVFTRAVTMPSRWPSDLIAFLRGVVNPDQRLRIDTFEKFRQHLYMERIKWRDVFDRKMVPIFVPPKEHVDDFSRRNYRATISMPLSSHRMARHRSKHLMRHLHLKDEHQQSSDAEKGQQSQKELDEEVVKLSARFKKYNRFRCETKIAEPRQSLDYMMDHSEVLAMAAATLPPMPRNGDSSNSQRKRTASRTRSPKVSSSVRRTEESSSGSGRPFLQADRVRMFHKNNREVNYSM